MIALVLVQTVVLVVLTILVAGLLRAYASVLRRLNELDGTAGTVPFRTEPGMPPPSVGRADGRVQGRAEWSAGHDLSGVGLSGEVVSLRTVGVDHDTVIAFLSSGCEGCIGFWEQLRTDAWSLPGESRLVVITKGPDAESPALLEQLTSSGVDLIMSSAAWTDYAVPGSPFVVVVDGRTGRIKGEGTGTSFSQVGALIAQAVGDLAGGNPAGGNPDVGDPAVGDLTRSGWGAKPAADRERERDVDRVLLAAGIGPGDASLWVDTSAPPRDSGTAL